MTKHFICIVYNNSWVIQKQNKLNFWAKFLYKIHPKWLHVKIYGTNIWLRIFAAPNKIPTQYHRSLFIFSAIQKANSLVSRHLSFSRANTTGEHWKNDSVAEILASDNTHKVGDVMFNNQKFIFTKKSLF